MLCSVARPVNAFDLSLNSLDSLLPFAPVLSRLLAELHNDGASFKKLAEIIETDSLIAARVLRVVNSPVYHYSGKVSSVSRAVTLLGIQRVRNIALGASVGRFLTRPITAKRLSRVDFNIHCVAAATMSDLLAQRITTVYAEGAFTAGLLHSIGHLLLACALPHLFDELHVMLHRSCLVTSNEVEKEILGFPLTDLSAAALERWRLPEPIVSGVREHRIAPITEYQPVSLGLLLRCAHDRISGEESPTSACTRGPADTDLPSLAVWQVDEGDLQTQFQREFQAIRAALS
ncbi:MAG: HDOD domain-containing protein [Bryobacterales bacterium]|nr:HDOD domain-containing protein [Bryobacterales bacterium]